MTILGYVNQADSERPATPFSGISSYSKVLGIKDPDRYAVFDARVAASLNAIQLLAVRDEKLSPSDSLAFAIPAGRNSTVVEFQSKKGSLASLHRKGFVALEPDATYSTYLKLLGAVESRVANLSILQIEMILFARAPTICKEAARA